MAGPSAAPATLAIRQVPDPVLRAICAPVTLFNDALAELADDMWATMYAAPGRGLAAPQVGVTARLFVIDTTWKEGERAPHIFVNPEVLEVSDETEVMDEGCLSIVATLETPCPVRRPVALRLAWTGLDGVRHEAAFEGSKARCILHEIDHLDGVLCTDRVEPADAAGATA